MHGSVETPNNVNSLFPLSYQVWKKCKDCMSTSLVQWSLGSTNTSVQRTQWSSPLALTPHRLLPKTSSEDGGKTKSIAVQSRYVQAGYLRHHHTYPSLSLSLRMNPVPFWPQKKKFPKSHRSIAVFPTISIPYPHCRFHVTIQYTIYPQWL